MCLDQTPRSAVLLIVLLAAGLLSGQGMAQQTELTPALPALLKPTYGIFLLPEDLAELRAKHQAALDETGLSPYLERASALRALQPEKAIHEFANSGGRHNEQHGRVRDEAMTTFSGGIEAARTAHPQGQGITAHRRAVRPLARHVRQVGRWLSGAVPRQRVGIALVPALVCQRRHRGDPRSRGRDVHGRRAHLRHAASHRGGHRPGQLHHVALRLSFPGQPTGVRHPWPPVRVSGHGTSLAARPPLYRHRVPEPARDVRHGHPAGRRAAQPPAYVGATLGRGIEMLELFARARGEDLRAVLPDSLKKTGDYGAVIASTVPEADVIPYGDSGTQMRSGTLLSLAHLAPGSYWTTMLHKCLDREQRTTFSPEEKRMLDTIPEQGPPAPPFIMLRDTGHMASARTLKGPGGSALPVKILILGNRGGEMHDHEHEDRGSFVLEFAGEAFAMDPGICEYEDPMAELMKQCQYHNMLAPADLTERPAPARPILVDVKAAGKGNRKSFHAGIDASPGWGACYKYWRRSWDSPTPETLTIRDEYELVKGDGVEFYWQTQLPCRIDGQQVTIRGTRGSMTLDAPEDCSLRIDSLPGPENTTQNRIVIQKRASSGILEVRARLRAQ